MAAPTIPADVLKLARATYAQLGRGSLADEQAIAQAIMADRAGRIDVSGLTERQADCLRAIHRHHLERGASPTVRDLMAALGLGSTSGVQRLLDELEDRGRIKRLPNRTRSITIVTAPAN